MARGTGCTPILCVLLLLNWATGTNSKLDVGFIIDGSGSIRDTNPQDGSYDNWDVLLEFIANLINQLPESGTRVGAVVFSRTANVVFHLNTYSNLSDASAAILRLRHPNSDTNTAAGLAIAKNALFNTKNGNRENVKDVAVLITDGNSTINTNLTIPTAQRLHKDNIRIICVGIGKKGNTSELVAISSPPHAYGKDYYTVANFSSLQGLNESILNSIVRVVTAETLPIAGNIRVGVRPTTVTIPAGCLLIVLVFIIVAKCTSPKKETKQNQVSPDDERYENAQNHKVKNSKPLRSSRRIIVLPNRSSVYDEDPPVVLYDTAKSLKKITTATRSQTLSPYESVLEDVKSHKAYATVGQTPKGHKNGPTDVRNPGSETKVPMTGFIPVYAQVHKKRDYVYAEVHKKKKRKSSRKKVTYK